MEHPIIFSGPMVRAILEGRKTMARRVMKFPKHAYTPDLSWIASINPDGKGAWIAWGPKPVTDDFSRKAYSNGGGFSCPYGRPGDLLWVRETWAGNIPGCPNGLTYRADHLDPRGDGPANPIKWQPSIFMPRRASRLTLEITSVKVERVQDISEEDAWTEGISEFSGGKLDALLALGGIIAASPKLNWREFLESPVDRGLMGAIGVNDLPDFSTARGAFAALWNSINGKRPGCDWASNPWCWVIAFKRQEA